MRNITKLILVLGIVLFSTNAKAQLQDEQSVTVTMELQSILHLDMSGPDQIEFIFDDIKDYYSGITRYGATTLKVSSTVTWDLYAVARSNAGDGYWDQQIDYGTNTNSQGTADIPLSCLELHQDHANPASVGSNDYSTAFSEDSSTPDFDNSIYVDPAGGFAAPTANERYIAGDKGTTASGTDGVVGGSYLAQSGVSSNYYYNIDYRILPGMPVVFPNAASWDNAGSAMASDAISSGYAEPGVYTMYVQYILVEDQ